MTYLCRAGVISLWDEQLWGPLVLSISPIQPWNKRWQDLLPWDTTGWQSGWQDEIHIWSENVTKKGRADLRAVGATAWETSEHTGCNLPLYKFPDQISVHTGKSCPCLTALLLMSCAPVCLPPSPSPPECLTCLCCGVSVFIMELHNEWGNS